MELLGEHLEILASHVFDNDKLVTYKWLSKELHVHVNIAKQILWEFYQKYKGNNIECTYLLIGILKDKEMRVEVVKESDVTKATEKFIKIVSKHLYSVHKPLADLELLASSGSGDINYSAIKCDICKERSDEEMHLLRWGVRKVTVENSKPINPIHSAKTEKNLMTANRNGFNNLFNMAGKSKSPEKLKSSFQECDKNSLKKDQIFCKEKNLTKTKDSTEKDEALMEETKELKEKEKDTVEKVRNFVQKDLDSAEKIKDSTRKNKVSNSTIKKVSPQSNSMKKGNLNNFLEKTSSKPVETASLEKKSGNVKDEFADKKESEGKKNLHGKKRNRSKETDQIAKKRKRVVVESNSSDSEMEEIIPEPEQEVETSTKPKSPSPPRVKHENGKKRVLKLVNKTYKEGEYIVTKKEHVYVSCSEGEEEKEEEMRRKDKKIETKVEKVKKKQSTLTNFFKRS